MARSKPPAGSPPDTAAVDPPCQAAPGSRPPGRSHAGSSAVPAFPRASIPHLPRATRQRTSCLEGLVGQPVAPHGSGRHGQATSVPPISRVVRVERIAGGSSRSGTTRRSRDRRASGCHPGRSLSGSGNSWRPRWRSFAARPRVRSGGTRDQRIKGGLPLVIKRTGDDAGPHRASVRQPQGLIRFGGLSPVALFGTKQRATFASSLAKT